MTDDIEARARSAGIAPAWTDIDGVAQRVAPEILSAILDALGPPPVARTPPLLVTGECDQALTLAGTAGPCRLELEDGTVLVWVAEQGPEARIVVPPIARPGYHRLRHAAGDTMLAIAPARCWSVFDATGGRRAWGLTAQLYGLHRTGDDGLGDFTALTQLIRHAGEKGAGAIGISPVHAQFTSNGAHYSPYFPSSRVMLNALYVDPGIVGTAEPGGLLDWLPASERRIAACRAAFQAVAADPPQRAAFAAFRRERGDSLERHARFEALHAVNPAAWDWRVWPAEFHDPSSPGVGQFAAANAEEVTFHAYLQFLADRGLAQAQAAARLVGMPIGLITDLAVGVAPHGSDAWAQADQMLKGLTIGAPPDMINRQGQNWGVTSFSPSGLVACGYEAFLQMLRTALRHAGGVRIDHVMGLARLWVIPEGAHADQGAYLSYPLDDLLRLIRLESWRHRGIVLGEDLGTVPDGFRQRLAGEDVAGLRVLMLERQGRGFIPPSDWGRHAVAMTSTHDLPTVAGWWTGQDLVWRERLGVSLADDQATRAAERDALWSALQASGVAEGEPPPTEAPERVVDAACGHLGQAACDLALLPLEDALGLLEQPNLPGTIDEHPNWRRRFAAPSHSMLDAPAVAARLAALSIGRP